MAEDKKSRSYIVPLVFLICGAVILAAGIIVWKVGGIDKYIELESFSVTDQPLEDVKKLDIQIQSADVEIRTGGEKLQLSAENVPAKLYDHGIRDNTFVLKSSRTINVFGLPDLLNWFGGNDKKAKITITIPEKDFDKIDLDIGAGNGTIEGLSAEEISFDFGAVDIKARNITASKKFDVDSGTGSVLFEDCKTGKVDIDGGIGELTFEGTVADGLKADCGIGQVNITIFGSYNDYDVDAETGIGSINIEKNSSSSSHGNIPVKVNGGIGEVNLKFVNK